jgi:hypothetical protein
MIAACSWMRQEFRCALSTLCSAIPSVLFDCCYMGDWDKEPE